MKNTIASIKTIPDECVARINVYGDLIRVAIANGNEQARDFTSRKLRGYLNCLEDLEIIDSMENKLIHSWVISGHAVGAKSGVYETTFG